MSRRGSQLFGLAAGLLLSCWAVAGWAADGYFVGAVNALDYTANRPTPKQLEQLKVNGATSRQAVEVTEAESVAFLSSFGTFRGQNWNQFDGLCLAVHGPAGKIVKGALYSYDEQTRQASKHPFQVTLRDNKLHNRAFWQVWGEHYERLIDSGVPGTAWFRHQSRRAREALGTPARQNNRRRRFFGSRTSQLQDTYALMSGGRALSENLQLDRELPNSDRGAGTVKLASISGITVREFDWGPMIKDAQIEADPLAAYIPSDQHAIFVPSFAALLSLADNADANGTPILQLAEPRSVDAMSRSRYERQLCLSLNSGARLIGPQLIKSMAMTGGDAYLRTGTDVALLFEPQNALALRKFVDAQVLLNAKLHGDAAEETGEIHGVSYRGFRSPNRQISSYVATVGGIVVVTNSTTQLERVVETFQDKRRSLQETPEYTFFRMRYPRSDAGETGLLILSDETIRRWCGPKWRIAASRRTQVAAVMAELQARSLGQLVDGAVQGRRMTSPFAMARGEEFVLAASGVMSDAYGDLGFQTPILEMDLVNVTPEEARLYRRWRDGYQRNWSRYFDPIAVRFQMNDASVAADVTVMPLIDNSRYNQWMEISKGATLTGAIGDPHPESLLHWAFAINPDSPVLKQYTNIFRAFAPEIRVDPLSWIGNGAALYLDTDPLLLKAAKSDDPEQFVEDNLDQTPVAFHVEVRDGLKLTLFLTGLRAFIDQTVPGMTNWESLEHNGEPYVRIRPTARANVNNDGRNLALYYVASGEGLTLTPNENLIKRVLDRRVARRKAKQKGGPQPAGSAARWDGQNVALKVSEQGVRLFQQLFGQSYRQRLQQMCWQNLDILNEWRRLHPDSDPVEVHRLFWHQNLYCPGGGKYVWNEQLQTMESTAYGSPRQPKSGPALPKALQEFAGGDFGVTFEEHGLRAQMILERESTAKAAVGAGK